MQSVILSTEQIEARTVALTALLAKNDMGIDYHQRLKDEAKALLLKPQETGAMARFRRVFTSETKFESQMTKLVKETLQEYVAMEAKDNGAANWSHLFQPGHNIADTCDEILTDLKHKVSVMEYRDHAPARG